MKKTIAFCVVALAGLMAPTMSAQAGVRIGIGIGGPMYYGPRPYYGYGYPYGYGYGYPYYGPGYVAPPPIVYQVAPPPVQAPIVVRSSPPNSEPVPPPPPPPGPGPSPGPAAISVEPAALNLQAGSQGQNAPMLQRLNDPNETARRDAALDLGRMKAQYAVDPLLAMLSKDSSAMVRDAAARALGLIASPRSLNGLIYAAQADNDREVRHSAQFAVEVIRNNLRGQ